MLEKTKNILAQSFMAVYLTVGLAIFFYAVAYAVIHAFVVEPAQIILGA